MNTANLFLRNVILQDSGYEQCVRRQMPAQLVLALSGALLASALASTLVLAQTGMQIVLGDFIPLIALALVMLLLAVFCDWRYDDKRLAHAAAVVAIVTLALMACGVLSNAGLRLRMPLSDPLLAGIDARIGIHVGSIIQWTVRMPRLIDCLALIYNASHILLAMIICWMIVRSKFIKVWELVATVTFSMQIVAMVSILMPAWGAMRHFSLFGLQGNGLPSGAGVYHGEAFSYFYEGTYPLLTLAKMNGVVTFPSFHTVLALLIAQALFHSPLRWLSIAVCLITIFSTIPIGGHYVVDLAGGAFIWLGCAILARKLVRAVPKPQP